VEFLRSVVGITEETLRKYLVEHSVDLMTFDEQLLFVEAIYDGESPLTKMLKGYPYRSFIANYFNSLILKNGAGKECVLLVAGEKSRTKWALISIEEDDFLAELKGVVAEQFLLIPKPKAKNQFFILRNKRLQLRDISEVNRIVTFIYGGLFKKKDLENRRAINSNGANIMNVENLEIRVQIEDYVKLVVSGKDAKKKDVNVISEFSKLTLGGVLEMMVRFLNDGDAAGVGEGDRKIYYLRPIENVYTMANSIFG
jgi:hypothetical protein